MKKRYRSSPTPLIRGMVVASSILLSSFSLMLTFVTMTSSFVPVNAQLQLNADTICVLNPEQCDEARQQEFSDTMERAMQEAFEEDYKERTGEQLPTTDELMQDAEEEGDFDDEREGNEMQENGIEINEATGDPFALSAEVRPKGYDTDFAIEFLNQTFSNMLNSTVAPEIETEDVLLDSDDEEDTTRQIIFYEFNPDSTMDDIRIYTSPDQTVQALATHIATSLNSTDITLYENGRAMIFCEGAESFDEADDTTIYVPHNYTAANGYVYTNGTIMSPTGQELLSTAYGMHGIEDYMAEAEVQQC